MSHNTEYSIGSPNKIWDKRDKQEWLSKQTIKRSYNDEVLRKLESLRETLQSTFEIDQYGQLSFSPEKYPLFIVKSKNWKPEKPLALITGGVHGYETSGVQGALRFLETSAKDYCDSYNLLVAPCISPWGYETINRWNPYCIDPNRSFNENGDSEEATFIMQYLKAQNLKFAVHIDLHETTDTDNSEFRPALAARDNIHQPYWDIPDGLYLVGDSDKPADDFQAAIIKGVSKVTHIAPSDKNGKIIGVQATQEGVINYEVAKLGLATGMTDCIFSSTTEVYPDSENITDEICIEAQVAAVCSGLDFVLQQSIV